MSLPPYPPEFWIAAITALILVGIAKAGFGSGPGLLATPLIALTIPVAEAAALLLPLLIIVDIFSVRHYRSEYDTQSLKIILPAAMVGILVGAFAFRYFSDRERILQIGIGVLALVFVLFQAFRTLIFGAIGGRRPPGWLGMILGAIGGFTSTLAHAGGPPVTIYLLPQHLARNIFVGTTVIIFFVINLVKLIPYSILGLLRVGNLLTILILSPFALIGVSIGIYLNRRFRDDWFNRIIYVILFLTGLQLVIGRSLLSLFVG